jgi:hypothetical protein
MTRHVRHCDEKHLRRQVDLAVARALVDPRYAAALLAAPGTVLPGPLFANRSYASLFDFACAAKAALWPTRHDGTTVLPLSAQRRRTAHDLLFRGSGDNQKGRCTMPNFETLAEQNPNIRAQYDEWRELRTQSGEDPTDYQAFRQHVMSLGAPDPGEAEVDDFVGDDFKASHPERYSA